MRYDIYAALTEDMSSYQRKDGLEKKILKSMIPIDLERNVKQISNNYVLFDASKLSDNVELVAKAKKKNEKSSFDDVIFFSAGSIVDNSLICSEEILGYNQDQDLCYSCTEIIANDENTLILAGTVAYKNTDEPYMVKLGSWVYNNDLIKEYEPLTKFCSSYFNTVDVYSELKNIQKQIKKQYLIPEDYVCATINGELNTKNISIDNDGEIESQKTYAEKFNEEFKDSANFLANPKKILKKLQKVVSPFLYIQVCNSSLYGKFSVLNFINTIEELIPQEIENEDRKAKQLQKKA